MNYDHYGSDFTNQTEEALHRFGKMVVTLINSTGEKENLIIIKALMKIVPDQDPLVLDLLIGHVVTMLIVNAKLLIKAKKCAYLNN